MNDYWYDAMFYFSVFFSNDKILAKKIAEFQTRYKVVHIAGRNNYTLGG